MGNSGERQEVATKTEWEEYQTYILILRATHRIGARLMS